MELARLQPTRWHLLCTDKDQEHIEFATAGMDDKISVAQYLVSLPNENQLEQSIKKELKDNKSKII